MAATSGADFWTQRLKYYKDLGGNIGRSFMNAGPFGVANEIVNTATMSALGVVGRFGSGLISGASGVGYLHNKTSSVAANLAGVYKGGALFGKTGPLGGFVANTAGAIGQTIGGAVYQGVGNWGKFLSHASGKPIKSAANAMNKLLLTDAKPDDQLGVFLGKKVRPILSGWIIPGAVVAHGAAKGLFGYWDKFAASKAVNGPMDTEGVDIAPGAVNATYSPLLPRRKSNANQNTIPDNMGATPQIVLAGHAARNSGWLR